MQETNKMEAKKKRDKGNEAFKKNCFEEAKAGGYTFFALQDGGYCFASIDPDTYKKYGSSSACWDGKGGQMTNNVYRLRNGNFVVFSRYF